MLKLAPLKVRFSLINLLLWNDKFTPPNYSDGLRFGIQDVGETTPPLINVESNKHEEIMMHNVNIEELNKTKSI